MQFQFTCLITHIRYIFLSQNIKHISIQILFYSKSLFCIKVVSFDGSTTVEEFLSTLSGELSCREPAVSGFTLFSDDPIEKDMEHHIKSDKKVNRVLLI